MRIGRGNFRTRPPTDSRRTVRGVLLGLGLALALGCGLGRALATGVTPTNLWVDLYSSRSAFAGVPIPTGAAIAAFDPQNVQCGQFTANHAGWYGIMPCYGDDPTTGMDEGPVAGDALSFTVNGVPATPQVISRNGTPAPPGTAATWTQSQDRLQIDLSIPPRPPVGITLASAQVHLTWQTVGPDATEYEVWRSVAPYFAPGDDTSLLAGVVLPAGPLAWSGGAGVGDASLNYTYRVRSLNAAGQTVGISQAVGEFDFALAR